MVDYVFMLYVMQCEWSLDRPFCLINMMMIIKMAEPIYKILGTFQHPEHKLSSDQLCNTEWRQPVKKNKHKTACFLYFSQLLSVILFCSYEF